jgi:hypothetical protein
MLTETQQADLEVIRSFPAVLETAVSNLTDEQLDQVTIEGEWTVRQIVHHTADSHMNSFIRLKLILTEENPPLKPYAEPLWAQLADVSDVPISASLHILKGLHHRWTTLFESLTPEQWERTGFHSQYNKSMTPAYLLASYAQHCRDHLAQLARVIG